MPQAGITYTVQLKGLAELRRKLNPAQFSRVVSRGVWAVALELEGQVKARTPVVTGSLRASIRTEARGTTAKVGSDPARLQRAGAGVYYAPYVEFPTRAHIILPRNKRVLAWPVAGARTAAGLGGGPRGTKKGTGRRGFVYAARVRHPGTKGARMFGRALEESGMRLEQVFREEVRRGLEGMTR